MLISLSQLVAFLIWGQGDIWGDWISVWALAAKVQSQFTHTRMSSKAQCPCQNQSRVNKLLLYTLSYNVCFYPCISEVGFANNDRGTWTEKICRDRIIGLSFSTDENDIKQAEQTELECLKSDDRREETKQGYWNKGYWPIQTISWPPANV